MALELSILTLNIWGIPYISKDRAARVEAIGNFLAAANYDIISLQEVWSDSDYQKLKARLEFVLPYSYYFYSGVVGSGLCVFSKHKIVATLFHSWSVNGYFHRIQHGDWFGGKGVGLCRIRVGNQMVNFYTAHLHAEYDRICDDYMAHRVIQAYDTAQFIAQTRSDDCSIQILAGDLNTEPSDLAYKIFTHIGCLKDSVADRSEVEAGTNEVGKNSYSDPTAVKQAPKGKRIDYIFYRGGSSCNSVCKDHKLPLPNRVPGNSFSYSDHEGVYARLSTTLDTAPELVDRQETVSNSILVLQESIQICQENLTRVASHRNSYFGLAIGILFLLYNIVETQPPYGLNTVYLVMKFAMCGLALFFLFMATIWNAMEKNALLSGKLAMEISVNELLTEKLE